MMKDKTVLKAFLVLLFPLSVSLGAVPEEKEDSPGTSLHLVSSPEMLEMVSAWRDAYNGLQDAPAVILDPAVEEEWPDRLASEGTLAFGTKKTFENLVDLPQRILVVGRDVLVPIMNAGNPNAEVIREQGLSPEAFRDIVTGQDTRSWIEGSNSLSYLVEFLETDLWKVRAQSVSGAQEMAEILRKDPEAVGFAKLADLMALPEGLEASGLCLIPIDLNGDAMLDVRENIYHNLEDLAHGVYLGKYPRSLYTNLMVASSSPQQGVEEAKFLSWVLQDGQTLLAEKGYVTLSKSESFIRREKLAGPPGVLPDIPHHPAAFRSLIILLGSLILLGLLLFLGGKLWKRSYPDPEDIPGRSGRSAERGMTSYPRGMFFDRTHTWAFMEKEGDVRIGVDAFLSRVTGPITRVVLRETGDRVKKGEVFLSLVQEGKKLELKSPISGTIIRQNEALLKDASLILQEPYQEGWVYMVEPQNWFSELKVFLMGETYQQWISREFQRLKAFMTSGIPGLGVEPAQVMQSGGEVREGVLADLGPEVWEEFQTGFLNTSD